MSCPFFCNDPIFRYIGSTPFFLSTDREIHCFRHYIFRPLSAYNLFFKDERERILKEISKNDHRGDDEKIKGKDKDSLDGSEGTVEEDGGSEGGEEKVKLEGDAIETEEGVVKTEKATNAEEDEPNRKHKDSPADESKKESGDR